MGGKEEREAGKEGKKGKKKIGKDKEEKLKKVEKKNEDGGESRGEKQGKKEKGKEQESRERGTKKKKKEESPQVQKEIIQKLLEEQVDREGFTFSFFSLIFILSIERFFFLTYFPASPQDVSILFFQWVGGQHGKNM